jgi:hypothetical protein
MLGLVVLAALAELSAVKAMKFSPDHEMGVFAGSY